VWGFALIETGILACWLEYLCIRWHSSADLLLFNLVKTVAIALISVSFRSSYWLGGFTIEVYASLTSQMLVTSRYASHQGKNMVKGFSRADNAHPKE